ADTAVLLATCSLGRAVRRTVGIKVRQPLPALWVRLPTRTGSDSLRRFEAELRDELNVKSVCFLDSSAELIEHRFKPNLRVIGRKYGKLVPAITQALRELRGDAAREAAQTLEAGRPLHLRVDDTTLALGPDEVLVEASSPEGYAVAEE